MASKFTTRELRKLARQTAKNVNKSLFTVFNACRDGGSVISRLSSEEKDEAELLKILDILLEYQDDSDSDSNDNCDIDPATRCNDETRMCLL